MPPADIVRSPGHLRLRPSRLGLVFLVLGGRLISVTDNALINTPETPLAIAWVWLCFGETPSFTSLFGGVVVMAAVAAHVWYVNRAELSSA
jgi:drug/metabolite transporter (DMT)-like permease